MKSKIAVAVSGGVDSLVSAYLLKKNNQNIIGLHFQTGYEQSPHTLSSVHHPGPFNQDNPVIHEAHESHPIYRISKQLEIPIFLVDCRQIFKKKVIDYFINGYQSGRTPNPCMVCNPEIKFGAVLDAAHLMGATHLATGHYARVEKANSGFYHLKKGIDPVKDQSYFLALLSQDQLSAVSFPLGDMTKKQVVELACQEGLSPVVKSESQDICFIKNGNYAQFLLSEEKFIPSIGPIKNVYGKILGYHNGLHNYTIGQRRGINCPSTAPYYVVNINMKENTLIVGFKDELYKSELTVSNVNWLTTEPTSPVNVDTRIRYRHNATASVWIPTGHSTAVIKFGKPQPAVAPGQAAVCYYEDKVVAGGFIDG